MARCRLTPIVPFPASEKYSDIFSTIRHESLYQVQNPLDSNFQNMSTRRSAITQSSRRSAAATPKAPDSGAATNKTDGFELRRLKKRELDRRAQRMARERTKQRIAHLEKLVDSFGKQDVSGQLATMTEQLAEVRKERDELAKTLKSIASSIRSHRFCDGDSNTSTETILNQPSTLPSADVQDPPVPTSDGWTLSADDNLTEASRKASPNVCDNLLTSGEHAGSDADVVNDMTSPEVLDADPVYPKPPLGCDCCPPSNTSTAQPNIWRHACQALAERQWLSAEIMRIEDAHAEDIPVRAILDGWDVVESLYGTLPPLWRRLRSIDEIVFLGLGDKERLACLLMMHLLYSYHSEPTPRRRMKLPQWYLKR